jgi:phage tail sheath gpL-like
MTVQIIKKPVIDYFAGTGWTEKIYSESATGLHVINDTAAVNIVVTAGGFTMTLGAGGKELDEDFYDINSVVIEPADGTKQVETIQVTHAADASGTLAMTLTGAAFTGSPVAFDVPVVEGDSINTVAGKIRAAAAATAAIATTATISGATDAIIATLRAAAANDATLEWACADADSTGVTFGASANTEAGVAPSAIAFRAWARG